MAGRQASGGLDDDGLTVLATMVAKIMMEHGIPAPETDLWSGSTDVGPLNAGQEERMMERGSSLSCIFPANQVNFDSFLRKFNGQDMFCGQWVDNSTAIGHSLKRLASAMKEAERLTDCRITGNEEGITFALTTSLPNDRHLFVDEARNKAGDGWPAIQASIELITRALCDLVTHLACVAADSRNDETTFQMFMSGQIGLPPDPQIRESMIDVYRKTIMVCVVVVDAMFGWIESFHRQAFHIYISGIFFKMGGNLFSEAAAASFGISRSFMAVMPVALDRTAIMCVHKQWTAFKKAMALFFVHSARS